MKDLNYKLINIHKNNVLAKPLKSLKPGDTFYWFESGDLIDLYKYGVKDQIKDIEKKVERIKPINHFGRDSEAYTDFTKSPKEFTDNIVIYTDDIYSNEIELYGDCRWIYYKDFDIGICSSKADMYYIYNNIIKK